MLHLNLHFRSLWNSSLLLFLSHLFVFQMHTFTQQRHEPPHYTTNRYNLFTDIHHYNSFHLVPNSTMHVPSHLLIILNSSLRFRPRSSYPPSLFHTGNPCSLILLLLAGDVELNPGPSALIFTHLNIRSIRSFEKSSSLHNYLADHPTDILSLNQTWLQPTDSDNFISSLAPSGSSIVNSPSLTGLGGGLAVIHRSFLKIKSFRARNFPTPVSFAGMLGLKAWPRPRVRKIWPRGLWPRPRGFWPRGLSRPTTETERIVIGSKSIN